MEELLSYIVKNLVNNPDDVQIDEQSSGGQVNLILTVNPEDMGLIIGKGGQTIKAIRKLLITKAIVDNVRVNLQLAEPEGNVRPTKSTDSAQSEPEEDTESAPQSQENEETPAETETDSEPAEETTTEPEAEASTDQTAE